MFEQDKPARVQRYHQLGEGSPDSLPATFDEAKEQLRDKLRVAVSLRLRSDVPVGNYLSGGIDSSVITLLTSQLRTDRFRTFSIAFEDADFDESEYQNCLTSELDTDPFTVTVSYRDIEQNFERAVRHCEPVSTNNGPLGNQF